MNWLDYLLIAVLTFSAIRSFTRGFSREVIGLCAAIAALILGMWFYGTASSLVRTWITSDRAANFIGFLVVVFAVLLSGAILGAIVKRFLSAVGLSFFDRLLGACFGLLRGALIAIALLTAYIAFGPQTGSKTAPAGVVQSKIAPYLLSASGIFVDIAPMELKRSFREVYDEVRSATQDAMNKAEQGAINKDSGKK
jgi:membrane protein required for colicin V production